MAKPTENYDWAINNTTGATMGQANKIATDTTHRNNGWEELEKPPRNYFNYWMNAVMKFLDYIIDEALEGVFTFTGKKSFTNEVVINGVESLGTMASIRGETLGTAFTTSTWQNATITALSSNSIAYFNATTDALCVYTFNGATWSLTGSPFYVTAPGATAPSITALSSNSIAFIDEGVQELRKYTFNGSTWSLTGSGLAVTGFFNMHALSALSSNSVAFYHYGTNELRTYTFNGATWSLTGSALVLSSAFGVGVLTVLSSNSVAFVASNEEKLYKYTFSGSAWSVTGSSLSLTVGNQPTICALTPSTIVFTDTNGVVRLYYFNGSSWVAIDTSYTVASTDTPTITALRANTIAWYDQGNQRIRQYKIEWAPATPFQLSV